MPPALGPRPLADDPPTLSCRSPSAGRPASFPPVASFPLEPPGRSDAGKGSPGRRPDDAYASASRAERGRVGGGTRARRAGTPSHRGRALRGDGRRLHPPPAAGAAHAPRPYLVRGTSGPRSIVRTLRTGTWMDAKNRVEILPLLFAVSRRGTPRY